MDLINRPEQHAVAQIAARKGIATSPGVEMFIPQGVAQWELWTKQRAPESVMRRSSVAAGKPSEAKSRSAITPLVGKTKAAA